jgi:phosphatidylinositol phospholipase C gamma-1
MYCIGDAEFESLVKLVEYYEKHPLYRKMRLKYPVDQELVEKQGVPEDEEDIYNSEQLY